jgi:fluoride exporter
MNALFVALGGAAGSVTRYYVGLWVTNATGWRSPGTVAINVVGSFAIGMFLTASSQRSWPNVLVFFIAIGFLGGFTTFSAFTWQTYQLIESGEVARAILNVGASVAVGMLAVSAGVALARAA